MVIRCRYAHDGDRIRKAITGRLARFGLRLNEAKTRRVSFNRPSRDSRRRRAVYEFLGFTFYWGRSRRGSPLVKVKTSSSRLRTKLVTLNAWAKGTRSRLSLERFWEVLCAKVRGHIRYYGVTFNSRALQIFIARAIRIAYKWLNRRSQRRSFTWETFSAYIDRHPLPRGAIYHALY